MSVKVLVVDDDPINLTVVERVLSKPGLQRISGSSGPEALTVLERLTLT